MTAEDRARRRWARRRASPDCPTCGGAGLVQAVIPEGSERPCSRCRGADFSLWYEAELADYRKNQQRKAG